MLVYRLLISALASSVLIESGLAADEVTSVQPYELDLHTLHLWHLDEAKAPFLDEGKPPTPMLGLLNGAKPLQESFPGLGHSISFNHNIGGTPGESDLKGAVLISREALSKGPADRVLSPFRYFGDDGAFTYEAIVKLDKMPSEAEVIALSILSMDGEEGERIFNFRIERQGFLTFNPLPSSQSTGGAMATIPVSGPHAVNTSDWFHAAVSYNGSEGTPANLRLYWTRLDSDVNQANLIGGGSLSSDLSGKLGDLAIGNEARIHVQNNAEAEPFPGCIDEVRISSLARHPSDFLFVPQEQRSPSREFDPNPSNDMRPSGRSLSLDSMYVDEKPVDLPKDSESVLTLPSGLHRIDFNLQFIAELQAHSGLSDIRYQLEGFDDSWRSADAGMRLTFQVLDDRRRVLSQSRHLVNGSNAGWKSPLSLSEFVRRTEPLYLPPNGSFLRITMDSGPPDTTGSFAINNLRISAPGDTEESIWPNSNFLSGENLSSPAGVPTGWVRGGSDPAIAQVAETTGHIHLMLLDGEQDAFGEWSAEIPIDSDSHLGTTVSCNWLESYNVFARKVRQSRFANVPSGDYVFRAVGMINGELIEDTSLVLPFKVKSSIPERVWFWPAIAAGSVALLALAIIRHTRRRNRRRLHQLWFENAIEHDRIRIARDMHDDLGNRICFLRMTAALAEKEVDQNPTKLRDHLSKLGTSARELVDAMNELVWAVDPHYDTLDHLASHLTRISEDVFRESPINCRLDIPSRIEDYELGSDFRHHISLAVKEALYNVLKHAGPCEVWLSLSYDAGQLTIEIRDNGCGFDPGQPDTGSHGLLNMKGRLQDLGGSCEVCSSPGNGTRVVFSVPVRNQHSKSRSES